MDDQRTTQQAAGPEAQIFLEPLAPPSVLGLYALGASVFVLAAYWAGWFGTSSTPELLFPIVAAFGGIVQLIAAISSYRARNVLGTALFGTWGGLFLGYGVLWGYIAAGSLAAPTGTFVAFGMWLIPISLITWALAFAATMVSGSMFGAVGMLAAGLTIITVGQFKGGSLVLDIGGYFLVVASFIAWYAATALMLEEIAGREVLPMLKTREQPQYLPGYGEPGVVRG